MGSEQSRDAPHRATGPQKTEIANFDFRDDNKDDSVMIQIQQSQNNNKRGLEKYQVKHRSNSYLLEVGGAGRYSGQERGGRSAN